MINTDAETYRPAIMQARHWSEAAKRLTDLDALASASAWSSIEQYLNMSLRNTLQQAVRRLVNEGEQLAKKSVTGQVESLEIERFRNKYLRVETMIDFFAAALASRTSPDMVATLRGCDRMAETAMKTLLQPLGLAAPPVLTYIDKGLGASILKAGLRLWDGHTENPVAAIKIVRHNLMRPTALIHEAGHQVAHITGWNEQLRDNLQSGLRGYGSDLAETWANWSSEIAADAFAFAHTGFASVAALHDVVDGNTAWVFRFVPGDPHPVSYLRVLLGIEWCRLCFGKGPWDEMHEGWLARHPLHTAPPDLRDLFSGSLSALPDIASLALNDVYPAFRQRSLSAWIDPMNVHPEQLRQKARTEGKSFYQSHYLLAQAPLQRLAWNGYQLATMPDNVSELLEQQRAWMLTLGNLANQN